MKNVFLQIIHQAQKVYFLFFQKDQEDAQIAYWNKIAFLWHNTSVPIRPSEEEVTIYKEYLSKIKKDRVLILGSTPELRDLVFLECSGEIYLADFSPEMPFAMLKYTNFVDPSKEIWIRENWLSLPFPQNFFDIILGDLVLHQFPPLKEDYFLQRIAFHLKKDGVFISRFQCFDPQLIYPHKLKKIIEKIIASGARSGQKVNYIKLVACWAFADHAKRFFNRIEVIRKFKKFIKKNDITYNEVFRALALIGKERQVPRNWIPPQEKSLRSLLLKTFIIKNTQYASDYDESKSHPIILLGKK